MLQVGEHGRRLRAKLWGSQLRQRGTPCVARDKLRRHAVDPERAQLRELVVHGQGLARRHTFAKGSRQAQQSGRAIRRARAAIGGFAVGARGAGEVPRAQLHGFRGFEWTGPGPVALWHKREVDQPASRALGHRIARHADDGRIGWERFAGRCGRIRQRVRGLIEATGKFERDAADRAVQPVLHALPRQRRVLLDRARGEPRQRHRRHHDDDDEQRQQMTGRLQPRAQGQGHHGRKSPPLYSGPAGASVTSLSRRGQD
jgi:hypothetical protein